MSLNPYSFIQSNMPPVSLFASLRERLGVEDNLEDSDPAKVFLALAAASFVNWLKHTTGTLWIYRIYGVGHISPGPFDLFSIRRNTASQYTVKDGDTIDSIAERFGRSRETSFNVEAASEEVARFAGLLREVNPAAEARGLEATGGERRCLVIGDQISIPGPEQEVPPDSIWIWVEDRPDSYKGDAPRDSSEWIERLFKKYEGVAPGIPESAIEATGLSTDLFMTKETRDDAIGHFFRGVAAVCGQWVVSDDGRDWIAPPGSVIDSVHRYKDQIYSRTDPKEGLLPILPPDHVIHTRKKAEHVCEECYACTPCVEPDDSGQTLDAFCSGFIHSEFSRHDICRVCDFTECPHWDQFAEDRYERT